MASNYEVQYDLKRRLNRRQRRAVKELIARSIAIDYPKRTEEERDYFVAQNVVGNPNRGVGGPLLRAQQAYARPAHALAMSNGELIGHLLAADNASSRKPGLKGLAEIHAKLHLSELRGRELITHRYLWLGYAALAPELHQAAIEDPETETTLDIMIGLAAENRDRCQPVTAYPWDEEVAWRTELSSVGFVEQPGQDKPVHAFGPLATPVHQERWLVPSIEQLRFSLLSKRMP